MGIKYLLIILNGHGFRDINFQTVCVIGINLKSKVILMTAINSNGGLMAIKVLINGLFMPINLPNHLFMAISVKLMPIKIVGKEFEHFTAINFSFHFIKLLN